MTGLVRCPAFEALANLTDNTSLDHTVQADVDAVKADSAAMRARLRTFAGWSEASTEGSRADILAIEAAMENLEDLL